MLEAKRMSSTFYFFWINSSNFSGEFSKFIKIRALLNALNIPFSVLNMSTHNTFKCFKNTASLKGVDLGFPCHYLTPSCPSVHKFSVLQWAPPNRSSYSLISWLFTDKFLTVLAICWLYAHPRHGWDGWRHQLCSSLGPLPWLARWTSINFSE